MGRGERDTTPVITRTRACSMRYVEIGKCALKIRCLVVLDAEDMTRTTCVSLHREIERETPALLSQPFASLVRHMQRDIGTPAAPPRPSRPDTVPP